MFVDYLEILNKESWFVYCQNSIFIQDSLTLWWQLGVTNKIFIYIYIKLNVLFIIYIIYRLFQNFNRECR